MPVQRYMLSFPQAGVKTKNNACKPFKQAPLLGKDWKKWNRFSTKKILNAPSIKKTQFPLAIAWIIYCSQGPNLDHSIADLIWKSESLLERSKYILHSVE